MNSYYTNRIEGQHTCPYEIDQALRELFVRLLSADLCTHDGESILPGLTRIREVTVGTPLTPTYTTLNTFLARWTSFYGAARRGEAAILGMAAALQRLGWSHTFVGGNGRVKRLHTHLVLNALGYTGSLWSPLRGFARNTDRYYALLSNADGTRQGALDARGNLSEAALVAWISYVLDTWIDQASFMTKLLDFEAMKARIEACLVFEATVVKQGVRQEALRGLHYLFLSGEEISRGEFKAMLGMGDRSATNALGALIKRGLLKSDSTQGKVRFGLPQHALRFLFPRLWPEAEADAEFN
jgi:Fic family protein